MSVTDITTPLKDLATAFGVDAILPALVFVGAAVLGLIYILTRSKRTA